MSSTLVSYAGKQVWIHNAVGEVWLSALSRKLKGMQSLESSLVNLSREIDTALAAGWVVGPLQYDFDRLLAEPECEKRFLFAFNDVMKELLVLAAQGSSVKTDTYSASSDFLTPELTMLQELFNHPEAIPSPANVFILGKGWTVA